MKIPVKVPVMVRVDIVGALLMTGNIGATSCTKHGDARYKYVNVYVEDGIIKVVFAKSAENDSKNYHQNLKCSSA